MRRRTLTDKIISSLPPAPKGQLAYHWDALLPSFGVRVTDSGYRAYVVYRRWPGSRKPARRALGATHTMPVTEARKRAREWMEMAGEGVDPATVAKQTVRSDKHTFASVAEDFIRRSVAGTRKAAVVEREIRREFIERWGNRPIASITQHDVVAVLDAAVDRGAPYQAHNLLSHVRRLFNWAIGRGIYGLERSPCDRLKPGDVIGKKTPRDRILTDDELRAFWQATGRDELAYPWGPMLRLLLLTGQRKSEVSDAQWREFDLDAKVWTVPAERFKSESQHLVPLTNDALALLASLPRFRAGDHVFTTTVGRKPVDGFSKMKERLDSLMLDELLAMQDEDGGLLPPFVLHDLRRTVRTRLSALRVPDAVAEQVIGHGRKGILRVYDQHKFVDEMREALEAWNRRLREIVEPPKDQAPDNVVVLRG